jgi:hypothetical protein
MKKALYIEWIKFKGHPVFGILLLVNIVLFGLVVWQFKNFKPVDAEGVIMSFSGLGLYAEGYILETLSYIAGYFKYIAVILLMLYTATDYRYKMHRKQVMEGWSRWSSFAAKLTAPLTFTIFHILVIYVLAAILVMNPPNTLPYDRSFWYFPLFWGVEFLVLYALGLFLIHLTKKGGLSMIILLLYAIIAEPLLGYSFTSIKSFLPLHQSRQLIEFSVDRLSGMLNPQMVYITPEFPLHALMASLAAIFIFGTVSWYRFSKRDL